MKKRKIIFFFCLLIIAFGATFARRPEVIINPQFWAEDGVFWFSESYQAENQFQPFLSPKQGYFQTVSRVGAAIASPFDIGKAPIIFNLVAILATIAPFLFFLSSRFDSLIPKISHRLFLGALYLSIPGASEVHANLTNAQWHLAVLMILVIIAPKSRDFSWKCFDAFALLLSGLSGPFVFFGLPLAAAYLYFKFSKEKAVSFSFLALAFAIQLYSYLYIFDPGAPRSAAPLGASALNFAKILSGNVFLKGLLSPDITGDIRDLDFWDNGFLPFFLGFGGIMILGYYFMKSKLEGRIFLIFSFLILAGGLYSPQVHLTKPQWDVMSGGSGGRYYYLPIIAWTTAISILFILEQKKYLRIFFGFLLACLVFIGIPDDFKVKKLKNYHFPRQVEEFRSLKSGESYTFKIPPHWEMVIKKK